MLSLRIEIVIVIVQKKDSTQPCCKIISSVQRQEQSV